ncbi:MAG: YcxB family protein [Chitinophagaceae bacterium]|nr:YcxB family protein [Chitinophagaceae bacterium]
MWLVLMISFWFVLPMLVYRRAETFRHSFTMNFRVDEFTLEHANGGRSWPWKALAYFLESPHFFHLYFDSRSFLLVPKSGLKDSDEVQQLRHLLAEHVKRK